MIYVVSDLHCGDKGDRDNFSAPNREYRFNKFLDTVQENKAELYILGDLFDWWQCNFSTSIIQYKNLLDRLDKMNATYVIGNHDNALIGFINSMPMQTMLSIPMPHPFLSKSGYPFTQTIGNRRFAFLHGHEVDPYCNSINPGIGTINTIISGMLEDKNGGPFNQGVAVEEECVGTLERIAELYNDITFQQNRQNKMLEDIEQYRRDENADVVIYGHTHRPGRIGNMHFNAGTWARDIDTFVQIQDNGETSIFQWTDQNIAVPYETILA